MSQSRILMELENIGHHPDNPHKKYYIFTNKTSISARILRTG